MCGIAGIVGPDAARFAPALSAMCEVLGHRGPDAQGKHFFPGCALGHTRLCIIDLQSGDQPFVYDRGRYAVVFNGELYGYKDLRKEIPLGFQSTSDTECIPALYSLHGTDCIHFLPGMFAFGLWDEPNQRLFCGRDRFGEKPLYYAHGRDGSLVFSSEIKAIVASGLVKPVLSRRAVATYLALRYVPEGMTIYRNIHSLPPGHTLSYENGEAKVKPYWDLPDPMERPPSLEEATEEFRFLLTRAVRRCLVADVDVGLLLSGGLDSTTIAVLAGREKGLTAYSFGYSGARDERPFARLAAGAYGLNLRELTDETLDLPEMMVTLAHTFDEPFADPAAASTYMLCRAVSRFVKVALSGDGGDELLGGYDYWYAQLANRRETGQPSNGWSQTAERHWKNITYFSDEEVRAMELPPVARPCLPNPKGTVDDALRIDLKGFLPSGNLRRTDRTSMAHGLEVRTPFLDRDLAQFLVSLPPSCKTDGVNHKILLRRAFEQQWPSGIRTRGKQGFGTNVRDWLLSTEMRPLREYYLRGRQRRIRSLLPGEVLDRYGREAAHKEWHLLVLSIWLEHTPACSF